MSKTQEVAADQNKEAADRQLPPRWGETTRSYIAGIGLVSIAIFLYWVRPLLTPIFIAMAIAYALHPVVRWLKKQTKLGHDKVVVLVFLLTILLLIAIPNWLFPVLSRQTNRVIADAAQFQHQIENLLNQSATIFGVELHAGQLVTDLITSSTRGFTLGTENALSFLETTTISFAWLLIILVCAFYFLQDAYKMRNWLVGLAPKGSQSDTKRLIKEIARTWQRYVGGTLVIIMTTAAVMSLLFSAIGLPGAVLIGLLTGLLIIIPEVGQFLGGSIAILTAFFLGSDFLPVGNLAFAVIVVVLYAIVMLIRSRWLQPWLHGHRLKLHGGIVFVAILGTMVLYGFLASLVAVPVLATAGIAGQYARAKLFGLNPWQES